jgi:hypothetical protein
VTGVHRICGEIPFDTRGRKPRSAPSCLEIGCVIDDTVTNAGREIIFRFLREKMAWFWNYRTDPAK